MRVVVVGVVRGGRDGSAEHAVDGAKQEAHRVTVAQQQTPCSGLLSFATLSSGRRRGGDPEQKVRSKAPESPFT